MDSDESAGGDDDDVSADEDEERDDDNDEVKQPKLGKKRSKEMLQQEEPDEDIEGIPDLLDEILHIQGRAKKKAKSLQKHVEEIIVKHDELADFKSSYDCSEKIDSAMPDSKKLTKLISQVNKLPLGPQYPSCTMKLMSISQDEAGAEEGLACDDGFYAVLGHGKRLRSIDSSLGTLSTRSVESNVSKASSSKKSESETGPIASALTAAITKGVSHEMAAELAHAITTEVNSCFGEEATLKLPSVGILRRMSKAFTTGHAAAGTRKAIAEASDAKLHVALPVALLDIGLVSKHPAILFSSYVETLDESTATDPFKMNFTGNTYRAAATAGGTLGGKPIRTVLAFAICAWPTLPRATLVDFELVGSAKTGVVPSLAFLYEELKQFAAEKDLYLHMTGLTKKIVGMSTSAEYPSGTWFKGADTVVVLKFMVHKYQMVLQNPDLLGENRS
ncbi:unnamed protein product, partial [Symbiodinium sp. KB8]